MILCNTGPLVAAALRRDPDHHACVELFTGLRLAGRRLLVPPTVIAEVGYMIQTYGSPDLAAQFLESVAVGDFEAVELVSDDYARIVELVRQYAGFPLGVTDASVIALAERLRLTEVATLDHRHFSRHLAAACQGAHPAAVIRAGARRSGSRWLSSRRGAIRLGACR